MCDFKNWSKFLLWWFSYSLFNWRHISFEFTVLYWRQLLYFTQNFFLLNHAFFVVVKDKECSKFSLGTECRYYVTPNVLKRNKVEIYHRNISEIMTPISEYYSGISYFREVHFFQKTEFYAVWMKKVSFLTFVGYNFEIGNICRRVYENKKK